MFPFYIGSLNIHKELNRSLQTMKILLLFLCLFGAVVAEESRELWLLREINRYSSFIEELSPEREICYKNGLIYFGNLIGQLVTNMERLRFDFDLILEHRDQLKDSYDRIRNESEQMHQELDDYHKKLGREFTKFVYLLIAADQSIVNDHYIPEPVLLINEVKFIISKEKELKHHPGSVNMNSIVTEVNEWYQRNSQSYQSFMDDLRMRINSIQEKVTSMIQKMRKTKTAHATDEANKLEIALNLASASAIDMYQLFPIDSLNKADKMVVFAGRNMRRTRELETMVNSLPTELLFDD